MMSACGASEKYDFHFKSCLEITFTGCCKSGKCDFRSGFLVDLTKHSPGKPHFD